MPVALKNLLRSLKESLTCVLVTILFRTVIASLMVMRDGFVASRMTGLSHMVRLHPVAVRGLFCRERW